MVESRSCQFYLQPRCLHCEGLVYKMEGLILRAPSPPDITLSNAFYNSPPTLIRLDDCISAEYQMPSGDEPLQYNFMSSGSGDLDLEFPLLYLYGMHQDQ